MSLIKNASPQIILLGADDKSSVQVTPSPEPIPQHCPLFYIFAKKGPTDRLLLSASKLNAVYGSETFDINDKFFNHQTRFLTRMGTYGNTCMVQRLVPTTAGVKSNATIYLDVMETQLPNYLRNSDGGYVTDVNTGKLKINDKEPTINGYKIKFIKEYSDTDTQMGTAKAKTGTMLEFLDTATTVWSTIVVSGIPEKLGVNEAATLTIDQPGGEAYNITVNDENIATYDPTTKSIIGHSAGIATFTLETTKDNESPRKFEFNVEVSDTLNGLTLSTLNVTGINTSLSSNTPTAQLHITQDADSFNITSSHPDIIRTDTANSSYTAIKNGTAIITISTVGNTFINTRMMIAATVQGYISNKTCNIGIGQSKFVKLINYDKIVSSKISPTGFIGIDKTTGAIVGIKEGASIVSYLDKKGNTIETLTVSVKVNDQPLAVDEQNTPFEYPPVIPDDNDVIRSTMYPLFELKAKHKGEYYNNIGFSIGSIFGDDLDGTIVSDLKSLPYRLALYTKSSSLGSPTVLRSLYSEPYVNFVFKEKAINPNTDARMDFETVFRENWYNETDELKTLRYWEYEYFHFYRENFNMLTKLFLEKEKEFISDEPVEWNDGKFASTISWFDFTTDDKEEIMNENQLLNPFICKSSDNVNYFTVMLSDTKSELKDKQSVVNIASDNPIFLDGGSDGDITNEEFEALVIEKMKEYADPDSEVQDLAVNVESIFYDTGFSLDTKKELVNFITLRKDTALILSTHNDAKGDKYDTISDTRAIATALKNRLKLAPESEFYGTGVCRGLICGGTGKLRDGTTNNRIPLNYEIASKAADMMGSSTGVYDVTKMFDNYPGNTIDYLIDVQPSFIPAGIKPTLWNEGLVWAQPFDRTTYYFPALQTVYDNDTSVLNNFFVMMVLGNLNKVAYRVWSEFTGTSGMTNDQFIDAVTNRANELITDKYGNVVTIVPYITLTDEDIQRGYSWTMTFKLYGSNMRTVAVYTTEVYRTSDLTES